MSCMYCGDKCRATYIYVIGESFGPPSVKVGYAANLSKRLSNLRRQSGRDLALLHSVRARCGFKAMDIETAAHERLSSFWIGRGEWFACSVIDAKNAVNRAARDLGLKGERG